MNPYQAFETYIALRSHFSDETYDYFKYNGKTRVTPQSFEKRRDQHQFRKLGNQKDVLGVLVSNFLAKGTNVWVGDLDFKGTYNAWQKKQQALLYSFEGSIKKMNDDFASNFRVKDGQHPPLLKQLIKGEIDEETIIILNGLFNFFDTWREQIKDTLMWPVIYRKLYKYSPFVKFDRKKATDIVKKRFVNVEA